MGDAETGSGWYAEACRRARLRGRRRRAESTEWPAFAPPVGLASGPLGVVQAADREIARLTAERARALAEFAASRPASADRRQGERGAMSAERWAARPEALKPVSEWAAPELVVAVSISEATAERQLTESVTLVDRLPGVLAALAAGALHPGHLRPLLEHVAPIADHRVRAEVEASLLRWAAGRVVTPAQLGAKARREAARRDARAAARRLAAALKTRGVHWRPDGTDGMAAVTLLLTVPEARAFCQALGACADAVDDDPDQPPRTRQQKMADCVMDLVLRPGENDLPPVQILLSVVASLATLAGGDDPGEVDGNVVSAEMIRELVRLFGPRPEDAPASAPDDHEVPAVAAPASVGAPARLPVRLASGDVSEGSGPPWTEAERADWDSWSDEFERRLLAGELGRGPEPLLHELGDEYWRAVERDQRFWDLPDLDPDDWHVPDHVPDDWAPAGGGSTDDGPTDHGDTDDGPTDHGGTDDGPTDHGGTDDGWWSAADRAVDEAGVAVRRVLEAMGRATESVNRAVLADASDEDAWRAGSARFDEAVDAIDVLRACTDTERARLSRLLGATGGGGLAERPRLLLTDALSGALVALTDLPAMRRTARCDAPACRRNPAACTHDLSGRPGLGPPPPTDGYRPSAPLDRWVRARDRRCRQPGCRRRVPRGGELDHLVPHPLGETCAGNLNGFCTRHHRCKHQAPGWTYELDADGTLTVTTPSGLSASTDSPPY